MAIDAATVKRVAHLARIKETPERLEALSGELNAIIGWIEQLAEVDVEGVEPMTTAVKANAPLRDDVVSDGGIVAAVTANAPKTGDGFFIVPKVVE